EIDRARARGLRAAARGKARENGLRAFADQREANIDHLDRLVGRMMGVAMLVERIECGSDADAIARRDRFDAHGNLQREFLPDVTQVEMDFTLRLRGMAQRR